LTTFANAYAERFVRTIKETCTKHKQQRHDNKLTISTAGNGCLNGAVQKRERLSGMLNSYYREAA